MVVLSPKKKNVYITLCFIYVRICNVLVKWLDHSSQWSIYQTPDMQGVFIMYASLPGSLRPNS